MKTIRVIGIALVAILMSAGFSACSNDEPGANGEAKLVEMNLEEIRESGVSAYNWRISYDSNGKVSLVQRTNINDNRKYEFNFIWTPNAVIDKRANREYIIENGLVQRIVHNEWTTSLEYNTAGHLASYKNSGYDIIPFTWDGDRLIEFDRYSEKTEFSYGNQTCRGYFPLMAFTECQIGGDDQHLLLTNPELVNMKTNQLPIKRVDGDRIREYAYTFTSGGYIKTCTITEPVELYDGRTDVRKYTYTFSWR